jgi:Peptidase A4 family
MRITGNLKSTFCRKSFRTRRMVMPSRTATRRHERQRSMPQLSRTRLGMLALFLLIATSLSFGQQLDSVSTQLQEALPVRLTAAPQVDSVITMNAIASSMCVLHAQGSSDAKQSLRLFADDNGAVRFHVRPSAESDEVARFQLDCEPNGKINRFPLELRASSSPTEDMPAPASEAPHAKPGSFVLPALTEEQATSLSEQQLLQRGDPPRPDPEQNPGAFARWLKVVTKPATFVPPGLIANPGVTHKPQKVENSTSTKNNHWSGFELDGPAFTFDFVQGQWTVPSIILGETGVPTYSSLWIGLDGDGTIDLVQDGTEQDGFEYCYYSDCWDITTYYAWTEYVPQQPFAQVVSGLTVDPGDEIYSFLDTCTFYGSDCEMQPLGSDAQFVIWDMTRGEYTIVYTPSLPYFCLGIEAEWILERPEVNGSFPDLADYGFAGMGSAAACNYAFTNCMDYGSPSGGVTTKEIWMNNGNDLLSWVLPISDTEMQFQWWAWH